MNLSKIILLCLASAYKYDGISFEYYQIPSIETVYQLAIDLIDFELSNELIEW